MDYRVLILLSIEGIIAFSLLEALGCLPALKERLQCALLLFLALFIRLCFFDKVNTDYEWFLKVWVNYFRENGGIKGLGQSLGNYNVPYMVFLSLFSYSSVSDLYLIKLLSIFFDIILAFASALLAVRCGGSRKNQLITFFAVMFLPTVVLNSAYWGQCDSIYVSFALLGIAAALPDEKGKGHPALSVICIAVSFSFKLQAVFLMPVWIMIWGWRKYRYSWIALFPAKLIFFCTLAGWLWNIKHSIYEKNAVSYCRSGTGSRFVRNKATGQVCRNQLRLYGYHGAARG